MAKRDSTQEASVTNLMCIINHKSFCMHQIPHNSRPQTAVFLYWDVRIFAFGVKAKKTHRSHRRMLERLKKKKTRRSYGTEAQRLVWIRPKLGYYGLPTHRRGAHRIFFIILSLGSILKSKFWSNVAHMIRFARKGLIKYILKWAQFASSMADDLMGEILFISEL